MDAEQPLISGVSWFCVYNTIQYNTGKQKLFYEPIQPDFPQNWIDSANDSSGTKINK